MITQDHPKYHDHIDPEKGFWIFGKDKKDCLEQLKEYGAEHPEKWIYYYDAGMSPGKPVPVATQCFEVEIFNKEPAALMMFWILFQKGKDNLHEDITPEMRKKQMLFFAMLGGMNRDSNT